MMSQPSNNTFRNHIRDIYGIILLSTVLFLGILVVYWFPQLYKVLPTQDYLTLHIIIEFLSIVISVAVFIIAWYNFQQTRSLQEFVICLTFLTVGFVDFAHAMSYNGMPDFFTPNSVNKASTYWIIARLIQAVGLLVAVLVSRIRVKDRFNPLIYLIITAGLTSAALVIIAREMEFLPSMYLSGIGQTPVKIGLEYVVMFVEAQRRPRGQAPWEIKNAFRLNADAIVSHFL